MGHAYPSGQITDENVAPVKDAVLNCVTALHTSQPTNTEPAYPHLRTLLSFDTREFFNVLSLAFDDVANMTCDKKQRIVDILLLLMVDSAGFSPAQVHIPHTRTLGALVCTFIKPFLYDTCTAVEHRFGCNMGASWILIFCRRKCCASERRCVEVCHCH